jgi:hypothetical protein
MVERHATVSRRIVTTVMQRIEGAPELGIKPIDPNILTAPDLARLLTVAAKLERLSRGVPAEPTEDAAAQMWQQTSDDLRLMLENPGLAEKAEDFAIELEKAKLRKQTRSDG